MFELEKEMVVSYVACITVKKKAYTKVRTNSPSVKAKYGLGHVESDSL